jgi:cobalamin biosynthesis protein CobD/CbiB
LVTATGWSWELAERLSLEDYNALVKYWDEECPPATWLIASIAGALGCKFGKKRNTTELGDAEQLMRAININPMTAPKWQPTPRTITFSNS